jgi:chromosome segregation ATPase
MSNPNDDQNNSNAREYQDETTLEREIKKYESLLEQADEEVEKLQEQYENVQESLDEKTSEKDDLIDEIDELQDDLAASSEEDRDETLHKIEEKQLEVQEIEKDIELKEKQVEELRNLVKDTKINRNQIKQQFHDLKDKKRRFKDEFVRMNFTLPKSMKDDWTHFADSIKVSASEMIRTAVGGLSKAFKSGSVNSLGEWESKFAAIEPDLKKMGTDFQSLGLEIEKIVNEKLKSAFETKSNPSSDSSTSPNSQSMPNPQSSPDTSDSFTNKNVQLILELKKLLDLGLISQAEFEEKRKKLLDQI